MTNIPETWSIEDLKDISSINYWNRMKEQYPNDEKMIAKVWKGLVDYSRDNARTPVQWSGEKNAGCKCPCDLFPPEFADFLFSHDWKALDEGER